MLPKWNLKSLFSQDSDVKKFLKNLENTIQEFSQNYKNIQKLTDLEILQAIQIYEKICEDLGKVGSYAYLRYSVDMQNPKTLSFYQSISEEISELSSQISFFTIALNSLSSEILNSKNLTKYKPFINKVQIFKPFELAKELEEMLIKKSVTSGDAWVRLYDETLAGMEFELEGKKANLTQILNSLSSPSPNLRKSSAKSLGKELKKNEKLITFIINAIIKDKQIEDKYRGFSQPIQSRNLGNFIEDEIVEKLIQTVKNNYPKLSHRYYSLKAQIFKSKSLKYWDRNAPLPFADDANFSFEQAKDLTLKSYSEFSPQIAEIANKFFENNWIDAEVHEGKTSGAFSHPTVPSANPFVMLNFLGKLRDVSTMAHELGHGVHQFLAKKQGALMADTPLTLAETASVFGEMLVFKNLLKNSQTNEQKLLLLGNKIEDMLNTVVRQIAFCEFEGILHEERQKGELSSDFISQTWLKVQKDSLGEAIEFEDEYGLFWCYISHFFHAPFYVYSYAFGDCLVNSLYSLYEGKNIENFEEKYIEMLEKGGSEHHADLLKPFNINLTESDFWQQGLNVIEGYINEFEELLKKL
jgi:oligoendopeptidase F